LKSREENIMERLPNIHPGEILREEFLNPLGITAYRLAKDIRVPATRIADILRGRRGISAETALRGANKNADPGRIRVWQKN